MPETTSKPLLYLIDALPYVFRAYFAIRDMTSPNGHPVNAVYGFTTFLLQIIQQEPLTHLGIAFDESLTSSFRNDLFPDYKANRELPPPELERQLTYCQSVARALGASVFVDQGNPTLPSMPSMVEGAANVLPASARTRRDRVRLQRPRPSRA